MQNEQVRISLAAARINAGMTQAEVCDALNISKTTLCSWEKGRTSPSIKHSRQLSELYKMPYDAIIFLPT